MSTLQVATITGLSNPDIPTINTRAFSAVANGETLFNPTIQSSKEAMKIISTSLSGNVTVDLVDSTIQYFQANSAARWNVNARGNATTRFNDILGVNSALTFMLLVPQGATAYNAMSFSVDSQAQIVKWLGGSLSNGTANAVESYTYTLIKLAANTYTVIGSKGAYV